MDIPHPSAAPAQRISPMIGSRRLSPGVIAALLVIGSLITWAVAAEISDNAALVLTTQTALQTLYVASAIAIFGVAWHTPSATYRLRSTLVACLFLPVAVFELLHLLSDPGMSGQLAANAARAAFHFSRVAHLCLPFALLALALAPQATAISGRMRLGLLGATLAAMLPFVAYGFGPAFAATELPAVASIWTMLSRAASIAIFLLAAFVAGRFGGTKSINARYLILSALLGALAETCLILSHGAGMANPYSTLGHVYGILTLATAFIAVHSEALWHPYAELQDAHASLRSASERHDAILSTIGVGVVGIDTQRRVQFVNPVAQRITALAASGTAGTKLENALAAFGSDGKDIVADVEACLRDGRPSEDIRYAHMAGGNAYRHENGNIGLCTIEYALTPVRDGDNRIDGAVLVLRYVTVRGQLQQQLLAAANYARNLFEASPSPLIVVDSDGIVSDVNQAAERMSCMERSELVGAHFTSCFTDIALAREALQRALTGETLQDLPLTFAREGGGLLQVSCSIVPQRDATGIHGAFAIVSDVSDLYQATIQLQFQADFDALTALPNRRQFRERVEQAITLAALDSHSITVMVVDLDDFKDVNDTLGTDSGDDLLKLVAQQLSGTLRETDTLARIGGDEFGILISDATPEREIQPLTERILAAVNEPLSLDGRELTIACSIGVSIYPLDAADADTLLGNADTAMHRAKEYGKNGCQYFTPEMNNTLRRRVDLAHHLRSALTRGEFTLNYQPQVGLQDGVVGGVEALLRWKNPELGFVSPAEFIPVAEETGLILPIGTWVLNEACRQAVCWRDEHGIELTIAVNLSARQFRDPNLVSMVRAALAASGLASRQLELELTESMLMRDVSRAVETMVLLNATGASLSIDDFGTGYSSLAYLKRFPIHKLKIDRSFVMDVPGDSNDTAIVRSIVVLAHELGMKVVAEGAETEAQIDFLRAHGCETVQGYFFSRPLPAADLPAFVAQRCAAQAEVNIVA